MNNVLYRKYRSRSFAEIVGQDSIISLLKFSISNNSLSHAYLFCGPRGTGKTSVARIFSKGINCLNFSLTNDVCNECKNCLEINQGKTMDIIEMDAASNRGIEEIRTLKESVDYLPTSLKRKIYIIDEAHMLTKEAFNALLKTLEEPPEHIIFILATTESHKLPITILSRVERYDFKLAKLEELSKKLTHILENENIKAENGVIELIFKKSGGSFRDAESLLGKILNNSNKKEITVDIVNNILGIFSEKDIDPLIDSLLSRDYAQFSKILNGIDENTGNIPTLIDQIIESIHIKIIKKIEKNELYRADLELINLLIKTKKDIKDFPDKKLIFELSMANLFSNQVSNEDSVKEIEDKPENSKSINKENVIGKTVSQTGILMTLAQQSNELNSRLKAILVSSKYEVEETKIIIFNRYKFNINLLEKSDTKSLLLKLFKEYNFPITEIEVRTDTVMTTKEVKEIKVINQSEEKSESEIDNSNLVEEILGK